MGSLPASLKDMRRTAAPTEDNCRAVRSSVLLSREHLYVILVKSILKGTASGLVVINAIIFLDIIMFIL